MDIGQSELMRYLYQEDVERKPNNGPPQRHKCVKGTPNVSGGSGDGNTLSLEQELVLAAEFGCIKCVKKLIQAGIKVNTTGSANNGTALIKAAKYGFVNCVDFLIKAGANVNIVDKYERTALGQASRQNFRPWEMVGHPSGYQHKECILSLIKALGDDVNKRAEGGDTPLMSVAMFGDAAILKSLIKAGADVNACDKFGFTALIVAIQKFSEECIEVLIKAGADVNAVLSERKETALMEAVSNVNLNPKFVKMLIKAGADVNTTDCDDTSALFALAAITVDMTPMEKAVLARGHRCMQILLQAGCPVNKTNIEGMNSLQCFFHGKGVFKAPIVILLLAAGEKATKKEKRKILKAAGKFQKKTSLKNLSREAVRKHMIAVRPHENLFKRVPHLKIPSTLKQYLLYDVTLKDRYSVTEDDDDDAGSFDFFSFNGMMYPTFQLK